MKENFSKSKVITSIIWKFMERTSTQLIQFVVQIVLARLLSPDDFGTLGILLVFINLSAIFVNGGFNTALIQKKEVNENDYSTIFYISLTISLILYTILFFAAPLISSFFGMTDLSLMLRVLALTLIIGAFISIQQAIISRKLLFRKLFFSGFSAAIFSGFVGIIMAYSGYGVWALVFQQLIFQLSVFLVLWVTVKWRPKCSFSLSNAKVLFNFSWKILLINVLNALNDNIRSLLIGKRYTPDMLGYYNRGKTMPQIIINNITVTIQSVMLPTLSAYQDDLSTIKGLLRRSIKASSFVIFPMMIGLAIVAKPVVVILLTDKWLPSVPFVQIFCLIYLIYPINAANLQATTALGRSDILLKNDLIKKPLGLIILIFAIVLFDSTFAIAVSMLLSTFVATFISMYPNKKILEYTYKEQLSDMLPSLLLSIVMGSIILLFNLLEFTTVVTVLLQIFVGVLIYISLSVLFKLDEYKYILKMFTELLKR